MTEPNSMPESRAERLALLVAGLACALASSAAFWLHMLNLVRMPYFINFVGYPAIVLMLVLGVYSWKHELSFWHRLRAGLVGGAAGLLAYDGIRFGVYSLHLFEFYPFVTHRIFGYLITGEPLESTASAIAGWTYHFWNGFSFAIIYALIAGGARWYWGLAWAMILEVAMLFTYPTYLDINFNLGFVLLSLVGHGAYGIALGLTVSRMVGEDE